MKNILLINILFLLVSCTGDSIVETTNSQEVKENEPFLTLRKVNVKKTHRYISIKDNIKLDFIDSVETFDINYLSDGFNIQGYLIQPIGNKKYPLVIYCRGGNRSYGEITHNDLVFLNGLASNGYVVIASNYRGSSKSEGNDEFGGKDVNDIINLYKLKNQFIKTDTNNVFLLGGSRGGLMVYQSLKKLHHDKNIRAAVVMAAPSDLILLMKNRPEMETLVYEQLIPDYKNNKILALKTRSVINWADSLPSVPILLIHGDSDKKVNVEHSIQLSEKLKEHNIPHKLIVLKGAGHGLKSYRDSVITERENWFKQYLN